MRHLPRAFRDNPYEQAEVCVCGDLYGIHFAGTDDNPKSPCSRRGCECEDFEMDQGV